MVVGNEWWKNIDENKGASERSNFSHTQLKKPPLTFLNITYSMAKTYVV